MKEKGEEMDRRMNGRRGGGFYSSLVLSFAKKRVQKKKCKGERNSPTNLPPLHRHHSQPLLLPPSSHHPYLL